MITAKELDLCKAQVKFWARNCRTNGRFRGTHRPHDRAASGHVEAGKIEIQEFGSFLFILSCHELARQILAGHPLGDGCENLHLHSFLLFRS